MANYIQPGFPDPPRVDRDGHTPLSPGVIPHQPGSAGNPLHITTVPKYFQPLSSADDPHGTIGRK